MSPSDVCIVTACIRCSRVSTSRSRTFHMIVILSKQPYWFLPPLEVMGMHYLYSGGGGGVPSSSKTKSLWRFRRGCVLLCRRGTLGMALIQKLNRANEDTWLLLGAPPPSASNSPNPLLHCSQPVRPTSRAGEVLRGVRECAAAQSDEHQRPHQHCPNIPEPPAVPAGQPLPKEMVQPRAIPHCCLCSRRLSTTSEW
jgi:hypothetical protein